MVDNDYIFFGYTINHEYGNSKQGRKKNKKGEKRMRKGVKVEFTDKQKRQIIALKKIGVSYREIGERYNVSNCLISNRIKQWEKESESEAIKLNDKQRAFYLGLLEDFDFSKEGDLFITKDSDDWGYQIVNEDRSYTDYAPMDVYEKLKEMA